MNTARGNFSEAGALKRAYQGAPLIARHELTYNGEHSTPVIVLFWQA